MDIIASMLAYLGCVTGIVGALVVSFYVYFGAPGETAAPMQTAAVVTKVGSTNTSAIMSAAPKTTAAAELKPVTTIAQGADNGAPLRPFGIETRQKGQLSRAQLRRLAQEERAKRWAYQQEPDFESRFMSYAD
jgi:hypothetical protein